MKKNSISAAKRTNPRYPSQSALDPADIPSLHAITGMLMVTHAQRMLGVYSPFTFEGGREKMQRAGKIALVVAAVMIVGGATSGLVWAKTAAEINSSVNACLDRFYKQVPGAKEAAAKAKGVLVMPGVIKAGLILGGEYGQGALRVDKKSVGYYNIAAGSIGLQIGAEDKDIIILFLSDESLKQFRASKGWEVGIDANVAVVKMGAGERVDFTKMKDPIVAFVFDVKGLMADISLKGSKFTKINPK